MTQLLKRTILGAGLAALALSLGARAQTANLNVKLGLWEATTTSTMTGIPPVDFDKMNLTPEQRAKAEAAMKMMTAPQPPRVSRSCLTQEKLNKPLFQADDKNCTHTVVSSSPTLEEIRVECAGVQKSSGDLRIEAPSPESANLTMKMTVTRDGKTMNVASNTVAKWIGSSCGDVK